MAMRIPRPKGEGAAPIPPRRGVPLPQPKKGVDKNKTVDNSVEKQVARRPSTSRSAIFLGNEAPRANRPARRGAPIPAPRVEEESSYTGLSSLATDDEVFIVDEDEVSSILASSEEWTDDDSGDSVLGLGAEGTRDAEQGVNHKTGAVKNRKKRVQITGRDIAIIRLLSKYKFGYRTQIEAFCDRKDLSRRLTQLATAGLLRNEKITQNQAVWTPTQAGVEITGMEVPVLTHGRITPTTIGHTVGLLNLGIGFEKGDSQNNLLRDPAWPQQWRRELSRDQVTYELHRGETVVTERMIERSWKRQLALQGEEGLAFMYRQALEWRPAPGAKGIDLFGPEAEEGNEWMFVGMAPFKAHIPDMVLVRPRNTDGSVRHVAIELELSSKSPVEWRRILEGFKGSEMFRTVAYFTHKRTVKDGVLSVNKNHVGLEVGSELLMLKYVPRVDNLPFWG